MNRQELHEQAQERMKEAGLVGDAWFYISVLTASPAVTRESLHIRLLRAATDRHINPIKRKIYQEIADSLDETEEKGSVV